MRNNAKSWIVGVCLLMAAPRAMPLFAQNMFLELNLNNQTMQSMMHQVRPRQNLALFRVIERAAGDDRIGGIVLNISSFHADRDTLWELRSALEQFKSQGKKICAFISNATIDMYYLASVADKIVMDELGVLTMLGYSWGRGYVRQSLEKIGIGVRELRYMEYKSAAETFTRDSLSDADRIQYGQILDDMMNLTRQAVSAARSFSDQEFDSLINNEFMFSAQSALERGLVDYQGRMDAVIAAISEMTGSEHTGGFAVYGDLVSSLSGSRHLYRPPRTRNFFRRLPQIAVIYASGVTDMERGIRAWALANTIREASENRRVRAIVLRVNSSGGSAEAADYVAEAIKAARQRLPVVVSMGSVAASGGYWMSMTANHIVASPVTLTGSIGVIGSWFYDSGLNDKLGLNIDSLQRGNHADMMTGILLPSRDLNAAEEERFRQYILNLYAGFTGKVAENRAMDREAVEQVAQGRVFSGVGALNAGLVDSIGGLDDAVRIARRLALIPEGDKVAYREFPKPRFFDRMLSRIHSLRAQSATQHMSDILFPAPLWEDIHYRITHNGRVMPLLPLDSGF